MILKKLQQNKTTFYIFLIALIILILPLLIRLLNYNNTLMGSQAYYHERMAESLNQDPNFSQDYLSYGGSQYIPNQYHYFLSFFSSFISVHLVIQILPILLGIFSLFLFYKILRIFKLRKTYTNLSCFIFIISPIFIYLFSYPHHHHIPFTLSLLTIYFILQPTKKWIFAIISIILLSLFSLTHTLILLTILIFLSLYKKLTKKKITISISSIILSILIYYVPFFLNYGFSSKISFIGTNLFNSFISDFGALIAFSISFLLIAILGIVMLNKKQEILPVFTLTFLVAIFSYYIIPLRFYLNIILVFLVSFAIQQLLRRKWQLKLIHKMAMLVILCSLSFSTISYINHISNSSPNNELIESMEWLKYQPSGKVLSHYDNGFWIESLANKSTVINPLMDYNPSINNIYEDVQTVFYSYHIEETLILLNKYDIKYILITPEMKQGKIWNKENQGFLLILKNSPKFKKIYALNDIEIWTYLN